MIQGARLPAATRARGRWSLPLAIEVGVLLLVPVILGTLVGWFELNPQAAELSSSVGSEAHLLLAGFPDSRLVVEVAYQSSIGPPPQTAMTTLEQRVNSTCSKSSIEVEEHGFPSGSSAFSDSDLLSLESSVRHTWPTPGTMAIFYLYLDGSYASDGSALGIAYRGSSIAVFERTIAATSSSSGAPAVDATVMVHEFGHELGLVGIIGPASNEDPNHPYHSNNPSDVMYWAVDSTSSILGGVFGGSGPPSQFDSADLADLSVVRSTLIPNEWIPVVGTLIAVAAAVVVVIWHGRRSAYS